MALFYYHQQCRWYPREWEALLHHIQGDASPRQFRELSGVTHQIEVKALYVFTLFRHLIERAETMPLDGNWKLVFVEAMMLLFPMLEVVGDARLGASPGSRLGSGIEWIMDPLRPPSSGVSERHLAANNSRIASMGKHMPSLPSGPRVRELFHIRNYFIHGVKNQHDPDFDIGAVRTSMNFELPIALVAQAKVSLRHYWSQLTSHLPSSSRAWVGCLADADIYPFGIMGSPTYERGLVDPGILKWITTL